MSLQFDVHVNRRARGDADPILFVNLQSDTLSALPTVIVAPVWPGPRVTPAPELAVRSRLDGRDLSLPIVELAFLRRRDLGPATARLLGYRDQIIRALDRLFTGI
ncbi:MAG: CcdB family protein [Rhizobiales bacterium]|nr:CcdB family protein [Hyphomicrobiales bacterium]